MKAFVITLKDNEVSQSASQRCIESHCSVGNLFEIKTFAATTPDLVSAHLTTNNVKWNYPWDYKVNDFKTGLIKSPYKTTDRKKRIACALSHYRIWVMCAWFDEPYLVLEHDALFTQRLDDEAIESIINSSYDIIGINDPRRATRRAALYHELIQKNDNEIQPAPTIDSFNIPQGLAGNSAYIIKPEGAEKMIRLTEEHGLWPNDALMCKQLISTLGVTKKYYTRVQGTQSTTVN